MTSPRLQHACATTVNFETDEGVVAVLGGEGDEYGTQFNSMEILGTNSETWSTGPPLPLGETVRGSYICLAICYCY